MQQIPPLRAKYWKLRGPLSRSSSSRALRWPAQMEDAQGGTRAQTNPSQLAGTSRVSRESPGNLDTMRIKMADCWF